MLAAEVGFPANMGAFALLSKIDIDGRLLPRGIVPVLFTVSESVDTISIARKLVVSS